MHRSRDTLVAVLLALTTSTTTTAEVGTRAKKPLDFKAYDRWSSILHPTISDDGRWVAFSEATAAGTGHLVVRSLTSSTRFSAPQGEIERPTPAGFGSAFGPIQITPDSRYVMFPITPLGPKSANTKADLTLGIMRLSDGAVEQIPRVLAFSTTGAFASYLSYVSEDTASSPLDTTAVSASPFGVARKLLTVRETQSGRSFNVQDVAEYIFTKDGKYLIYSVEGGTESNGVYARRLYDGKTMILAAGIGHFRNLTLDRSGHQIAFLSGHKEQDHNEPRYSLYYAASLDTAALVVVPSVDLPRGLVIAPEVPLQFVRTGATVKFGLRPALASLPAQNSPIAQPAHYDLHHWKLADRLEDGASNRRPRCGAYLAVYQINDRHWLQLANDAVPLVLLGSDGKHAVGITPYALQDTWDRPSIDVALIDAHTGRLQPLSRGLRPSIESWVRQETWWRDATDNYFERSCRPRIQSMLSLSPTGKYMIYFSDQRWWSVDLDTTTIADLTGRILPTVQFGGVPSLSPASQSLLSSGPAAGGVAGWTVGDRSVLIYSARDLWELDPDAKREPLNLTQGRGQAENVVLRLLDRDSDFSLRYPFGGRRPPLDGRDSEFIDTSRQLLLLGVRQETMATEIWRLYPGSKHALTIIARADDRLDPIAKARQAEQYLFTRESFSEFPDLWAGPSPDRLTKISDANPQQHEYRWGSAELVNFTSDLGVPLRGRLYKPENFDGSKRYPMLVSVYGLFSSSFHSYSNPQPMYDANGVGLEGGWPTAVSRGYVYFVPDIMPSAPYFGQAALAAVMPAVRTMINEGYVDPHRICLIGHSHGGSQVDYILTQTNLFRCAVSGAGVTDTISFATTRQSRDGFSDGSQFVEHSQLMHGASLWERPFVYLANSAVFQADRVSTPILILHNDHDHSVPFTQGIEFFRSLRRNGKEAYLVNYRGEGHSIVKYPNLRDWETRFFEFVDYYLKDGPRPGWFDAPTSPAARDAGTIPTSGASASQISSH